MKRCLLFVVMCSFLIQASVKTVLCINWKIYQREITELYCINKNKPEMQCNGKCYLAQQMRKIATDYEQSKQPFVPKNTKTTDFPLFFQATAELALPVSPVAEPTRKGGTYLSIVIPAPADDVFHPPRNVSTVSA